MKKLVMIVVVIAALLGAVPAQAHLAYKPKCQSLKCRLASQEQNLSHVKYIARHGAGEHKRWAVKVLAQGWLVRELKETRTALAPKVATGDIKTYIRTHHPCLADIIEGEPDYGSDGENGNYDPTLDFGGGHGNIWEAYGIPQANPGHKMKSAGRDWATNPWTQLKWMIGYAVGRYGGECEARAYKRTHNVY